MDTSVTHLLQYGPHHAQMNWGWGGWGQIILMVAFALLLVIVVLVLVRAFLIPVIEATEPPHQEGQGTDTALAALRERFARGEIDEEEYELRKRILTRDQA